MSLCTIINAHVTDQVIQLSNLPRIASGSKNALQIRCNFCGKWEGCGKTAVFYRTEDEVYHVPVVEGLVTVPWEVLVDEGYFWLGFMGEDDLTRTTEAIRIEVAKGALTVATATPQEPTPDIYQQIMAAYGAAERMLALEKARLDALVAVRTSDGAAEYRFEGNKFRAIITTNGINAHLWLEASELYSQTNEYYAGDFDIPLSVAPLGDVCSGDTAGTDLQLELHVVSVDADAGTAKVSVVFSQPTEIEQGAEGLFRTFYPVAYPSISELADIRAGYNGENYDVAGDAVRATQERVDGISDQVNTNAADINDHHNRLTALEQNGGTGGGGGITVDDVKPFRFTVTQDGARYTASKTYEEIAEVLNAGNRLVICEFNECELPFAGYFGLYMLFYTGAYGMTIYIAENGMVSVEHEEGHTEIVYVSDHGAEGDGETDDTEAIQAALDCGGTIIFDRKTYMVDAVTRLQVRSNSHIILPVGCTLQAMPTDSGNYTVLNMTEDVENVCISGGGKVAGDMSEDGKDPATQAGHGIRVRGSRNITIDGIEVCDCWGDCIAIHGAYDNTGNYPNGNDDLAKNVVVRDCTLHDARRSAISIQGCQGFKSINNEIYGVYGTIPECGMDFEGKPDYPNSECEVWNTRIHDVGVTGGITVDSGNASISFYGCELDSLRLNADIGKLNLKGCTIGLLRLIAITQLDKVLVHNCTIGRAEVNIESPDVEFHKCDFVPMGDEDMYIRFLSTGKATDEKRLNHATFEGSYFRTRPNNASDKKNALLMFSKEPLDTISFTNCVFDVYNQIGITIVATNGITFTHNTVKQVHAKSGGEYQYIMNFQTTQGTDSTIVFANKTVDLKGVKNYHYKSQEAMRLYAATVYMLNNLIESTYTVTSTDTATGKKHGLSAVLCKMAGAYNTKKAVVANNTVDGLFATHFTYPTTEGFVVKESNNLLLCEE